MMPSELQLARRLPFCNWHFLSLSVPFARTLPQLSRIKQLAREVEHPFPLTLRRCESDTLTTSDMVVVLGAVMGLGSRVGAPTVTYSGYVFMGEKQRRGKCKGG